MELYEYGQAKLFHFRVFSRTRTWCHCAVRLSRTTLDYAAKISAGALQTLAQPSVPTLPGVPALPPT